MATGITASNWKKNRMTTYFHGAKSREDRMAKNSPEKANVIIRMPLSSALLKRSRST
jgi:hypothetical protein